MKNIKFAFVHLDLFEQTRLTVKIKGLIQGLNKLTK